MGFRCLRRGNRGVTRRLHADESGWGTPGLWARAAPTVVPVVSPCVDRPVLRPDVLVRVAALGDHHNAAQDHAFGAPI